MKTQLAIILTVATVSLLTGALGDDETRRIFFVDYNDGRHTLRMSNMKVDIPIRLMRRIVADDFHKELRNVYLYAGNVAMVDSKTLGEYHDIEKIRVQFVEESDVEFVDFETRASLLKLKVDSSLSIKDLKSIISNKLGLVGKRIILYFGQSELKDEKKISHLDIKNEKVLLYTEDM